MIPLIYLVFAWLVLVSLFGIVALITVFMALRYGLSGPVTALSVSVFIGVTGLVLIVTLGYLFGIDWSQDVYLIPTGGSSSYTL